MHLCAADLLKRHYIFGEESIRPMEENILVLFDKEEEYAYLMSEFLRTHEDTPWEIHTYTTNTELLAKEKRAKISMLVVAESVYAEELMTLHAGRTVILNESGVLHFGQVPNIDKYQQAESVLKELLVQYMEIAGEGCLKLAHPFKTNFIGIYSPVRRCMQTSVALAMCQTLAMEHRTLYLNFEHYVGITELLPETSERDMADLLYFLSADQNKFRLRLKTMICRKGNLEYVPPMKSGQNLLTVLPGEWIGLLQRIEELGDYEYVVRDLSESMQGLFDILRLCRKVFTLTADDPISRRKLDQYEQVLALYEYQDILQKTSRHGIPKVHRYPGDLEQYTKGEIADYVRALIKEL